MTRTLPQVGALTPTGSGRTVRVYTFDHRCQGLRNLSSCRNSTGRVLFSMIDHVGSFQSSLDFCFLILQEDVHFSTPGLLHSLTGFQTSVSHRGSLRRVHGTGTPVRCPTTLPLSIRTYRDPCGHLTRGELS